MSIAVLIPMDIPKVQILEEEQEQENKKESVTDEKGKEESITDEENKEYFGSEDINHELKEEDFGFFSDIDENIDIDDNSIYNDDLGFSEDEGDSEDDDHYKHDNENDVEDDNNSREESNKDEGYEEEDEESSTEEDNETPSTNGNESQGEANKKKTPWHDIYEKLFDDRVLFLCQELDEDLSNQLINILLYVNKVQKENPLEVFPDISIFVNSSGGPAGYGISLYDVETYMKSDVCTVNLGKSFTTAALAMIGGVFSKRFTTKNSRFLLAYPDSLYDGRSFDIIKEVGFFFKAKKKITRIFSNRTYRKLKDVVFDFEKITSLSSQLAFNYGIVDGVLYKIKIFTEKGFVFALN